MIALEELEKPKSRIQHINVTGLKKQRRTPSAKAYKFYIRKGVMDFGTELRLPDRGEDLIVDMTRISADTDMYSPPILESETFHIAVSAGHTCYYQKLNRFAVELHPDLNRTSYPAYVTDVFDEGCECRVLLGTTEISLNFPASATGIHCLQVGDRFRWIPAESGQITPADIQPTERASDILKELEDWDPDEMRRVTQKL